MLKQKTKILFKIIAFFSLVTSNALTMEGTQQTPEISQGTKRIIEHIEGALTSRHERSPISYLVPPHAKEEFFELAINWGNAFSLLTDARSTDHFPCFGDLAEVFLRVASQAVCFDAKRIKEQFILMNLNTSIHLYLTVNLPPARLVLEFNQLFMKEVNERRANQQTSYEWFSFFISRLLFFITDLDSLKKWRTGFNTGFDGYMAEMVETTLSQNEVWSHESFKQACLTTGSPFTREFHSTLALVNQFPQVVMLPCPYPLNGYDLFRTILSPRNHVWLRGFVLGTTYADGSKLSPYLFDGHDQQHLVILMRYLDSESFYFYLESEATIVPTADVSWQRVREGRILFSRLMKIVQEVIDDESNESRRTMFEFFAFYLCRENTYGLEPRIFSLVKEHNSDIFAPIENFHNDPHYYFGLFSDRFRLSCKLTSGLSNYVVMDEEFKKEYEEYLTAFLSQFQSRQAYPDFERDAQAWGTHDTWIEKLQGGGNKIICHKVDPIQSIYNSSNKYEAMVPINLENGDIQSKIKKMDGMYPNGKWVMRYFSGSSLYIGKEAPEFVEGGVSFQKGKMFYYEKKL